MSIPYSPERVAVTQGHVTEQIQRVQQRLHIDTDALRSYLQGESARNVLIALVMEGRLSQDEAEVRMLDWQLDYLKSEYRRLTTTSRKSIKREQATPYGG